jgi:hypothetical protein
MHRRLMGLHAEDFLTEGEGTYDLAFHISD